MAGASRAKKPADVNALVAASKRIIEREKVIQRSKVAPPSVRDRVLDALRSDGFEVTAKVVRVPLRDQLVEVLKDGSYVALSAIASHLAGATAAEAKQVALALAKSGLARRVLRTSTETLVPATADVVADEALATALRRVLELVRQLQTAARRGKGLGVLREDVEQALARVLPEHSRGVTRRRSDLSSALNLVLRAVDAARDAKVGLSFVPSVVGLLSADFDRTTAQEALIEAASRGLVELRPEGGLGRLSDAERMACPEGPQGTRLSWVRRIEARS